MPPTTETGRLERPLIPTLRRFLPYLWPADAPLLRLRILPLVLRRMLPLLVLPLRGTGRDRRIAQPRFGPYAR